MKFNLIEKLFKGLDTNLSVSPYLQVMATMHDPILGYSDSLLGLYFVAAGLSAGFLRVYRSGPNIPHEIIPVDVVINFILVIAAQTTRKILQENIFFCCSGNVQAIKNGKIRS